MERLRRYVLSPLLCQIPLKLGLRDRITPQKPRFFYSLEKYLSNKVSRIHDGP